MSKVLRILDQVAAALILLTGIAHVAVANKAFTDPTEARVWFLSAGLMGIVSGLANLARASSERPSRLLSLAGLSGSVSMVMMGALLQLAPNAPPIGPASYAVFAVGLIAAAFAVRDLLRPGSRTS
jgi:hypothetical protein